MFSSIFSFFKLVDSILWSYVAFTFIIFLGLFFTYKHRFFQIRKFGFIGKDFFKIFRPSSSESERGVHPVKVFFAAAGGMLGIGNICGVVSAIQLGGPGALFWLWIAATVGSIVKYGEVYLGFKYRVENKEGGWDGGPMYFLKRAFKSRFFPIASAILLFIYGVDIYQFSVVADSVSSNWHLHHFLVVVLLLGALLFCSLGGVKRIGHICSYLMPPFYLTYIVMIVWVLFCERGELLGLLKEVMASAFTGSAAAGGFAGSTLMMALQHGTTRAAYATDLGIGKDAIIQSETTILSPAKQARISLFCVFLDTIFCTFSMLLVMATGFWKEAPLMQSAEVVKASLSSYFPFMHIFVPLFLALAGFLTMIAYLAVGLKCAKYLNPKWGSKVFVIYTIFAFLTSSFYDSSQVFLVMSLSGVLLLLINLFGIFKLRKEIVFDEESAALMETGA